MLSRTHSFTRFERLLRPRSVALIGASATPGSFGASVLANLEAAEYDGSLHLVNPRRATIGKRPCANSIDALPKGIDCAVLMIPRSEVLNALRACAKQEVGSAIVFSAGFAESGEEGRAEQAEMARIAAETGMLIDGPNCLGIVNYRDRVPLTFVNTPIPRGATAGPEKGIAILSQSGAMAAVLAVNLRLRALNLSFSISTGNEAAAGIEDFFEYMIADPSTHVIAMIVEQFRSPRKLLALTAQARVAGKLIALLHPGSSSGARASAATHTGALAGNYEVMKVKVRNAGILQVDTLEEFTDVLDILSRCASLPHGGAAVFTESGAFKALTLDFCEVHGLALPPLTQQTEASLRAVLPAFIPPSNPLDITAQGLIDPELYQHTLPPFLSDETYGSVILAIILTDLQTSGLKLPPLLNALEALRPNKPIVFAAMDEGGSISQEYISKLRALGVPFFPSPERAMRALALLTRFTSHVSERQDSAADTATSQPLPAGVITEHKSKLILKDAGIPVAEGVLVKTSAEAVATAARLGYPVVLKAQSPQLIHKSDVGGVRLRLQNAAAVESAWHGMMADLARFCPNMDLDGVLVEKMSKSALELILGAQRDPDWGPVILVGLGGVQAELMDDVRLLVPDLDHPQIIGELNQLRSAKIFYGFRGSPAVDLEALANAVAALGKFVILHPEIREIDINPLLVYPDREGVLAVDALIVTDETI